VLFFVCVSSKDAFAVRVCVCVCVDLCLGAAAVSRDGSGYNEMEEKEEEEELETARWREGGGDTWRDSGREVVYQEHTALPASSLSVVVLIQSAAASAREAPGLSETQIVPRPHFKTRAPSSLLQARLSSCAPPASYLSVSTPSHVSNPEPGPPYSVSSLQHHQLTFLCCMPSLSLPTPLKLASRLHPFTPPQTSGTTFIHVIQYTSV